MTIKFIQKMFLWPRRSIRKYTKMFKKIITLRKKFFFYQTLKIYRNLDFGKRELLLRFKAKLTRDTVNLFEWVRFFSTKASSQFTYTSQALTLAHTKALLEIVSRCCGALRKLTSVTPASMNGVSTQPIHCFNSLRQKCTQSYYIYTVHHSHTFSTLIFLCVSCW